MGMARKGLILVVGMLLIFDACALAIVKFAGGPKPSDEKSKVVFWIDEKEQAKAAREKLKEMNYEPIVKEAKRETKVQANYRLVYTASKRALLEPIARVLKKAGHKNLSMNDEGTILYYGGVYKQKAQAKRVAKSLAAREKVVFEVQPGEKTVLIDSHRIVLPEVPDNFIPIVTEELALLELEIAHQEEESLTPSEDEDADAEAEDEEADEEEEG